LRQQLHTDEQGALLVAAVAVYFAGQAQPAQQLACPFAKFLRLQHQDTLQTLSLQELGDGKVKLAYNGVEHLGNYQADRQGESFVTVDGLQERVCAVPLADKHWHVQVGGVDLWLEDSTLAAPSTSTGIAGSAEVRAKFNGKVIAIQTEVAATVKRGDTLLVIESMKLEHAIAATQDGVVASIEVASGEQATTGQILVRFSA
jgi:3-methylcrotonyl-CoA carboxylase alpha subunit/geranyl-CoA carboxylase alpha subunit